MINYIRHPGFDSGIDLITNGIASSFIIVGGADYTGWPNLVALDGEGTPVAIWSPVYWNRRSGWYALAERGNINSANFHELIIAEPWGKGDPYEI